MNKQIIIGDLEENAIVEQLEEVGKINIEFLDYDLEVLVGVLYEYYDIDCKIENQYLVRK